MRLSVECGIMIAKDGSIFCPSCRKMRLARLPDDGRIRAYLYCRRCRREQYIDVSLSPEPEPHDP